MIGQRFERWLVSGEAERKHRHPHVWCVCECGTRRLVSVRHLVKGHTKSCGCLKADMTSARAKTHGLSKTPGYASFYHMHRRCDPLRANDEELRLYVGRGIKVCDRWSGPNGVVNFFADMGPKPAGKYSIERIDNNKGYEPSNCKWATDEEQCNNTSRAMHIEYSGRRMTPAQWGRILGIRGATIRHRLHGGWSIESALTTPTKRVVTNAQQNG